MCGSAGCTDLGEELPGHPLPPHLLLLFFSRREMSGYNYCPQGPDSCWPGLVPTKEGARGTEGPATSLEFFPLQVRNIRESGRQRKQLCLDCQFCVLTPSLKSD